MKKIRMGAVAVLTGVSLLSLYGCSLVRTSRQTPQKPQEQRPANTNDTVSSGTDIDVIVGDLANDANTDRTAFSDESTDADQVGSDAQAVSDFDQSVNTNDL